MNEFLRKNTAWFQLYALTQNKDFRDEIISLRQLLSKLDNPFPTKGFSTQLQKRKWLTWLDKEFKIRRKNFSADDERKILHQHPERQISAGNLLYGWHFLPRINQHLDSLASEYGFLPFSTQRRMLLENYFYFDQLPVVVEKPTVLINEKQPNGTVSAKLKLTKYTQLSDIKNKKSWERIEWVLAKLTKSQQPFLLFKSEKNEEKCCYLQLFQNTTKSDLVENWRKISNFKKIHLGHGNKLSTRKQFNIQLALYKKYLELMKEQPNRMEVFKTLYGLDEMQVYLDFFKKSRRSAEGGIEYADLRKMMAEMKKVLPENLRII